MKKEKKGREELHQALYRKWRPQTFDEVCGQEHITSILKFETQNSKFSHAYLFCGSRGTGKTTCAKILAKAVNCEAPVNGSPCNRCSSCLSIDAGTATDVLEMDAASNNGVDNIRDIRDEVVYTPSALRYRVYIVDEVHMLSGSAFNALLKTLEEPPAHVIFILATTELHKLPSTIVSRCQRFDFRRITTDVLTDRLAHIAKAEGIPYETEALRVLARLAQGGMRDAISLLELCAGAKRKLTTDLVEETVGSGGREALEKTVSAIAKADFDEIFASIDTVVRSSRDLAVYWQELISYYRDMLVMKTTASAERYLDLTETEAERLKAITELFSRESLLYHCRILDEALQNIQRSGAAKRMVAEMALIKLCDSTLDSTMDSVLSRLSKLETAVATGVLTPGASSDLNNLESTGPKQNTSDKPHSASDRKEAEATAHTGTPAMKILRGWNEMAEKAAAGDGSSLGFLRLAKAFHDEKGRVYLKLPNDFARSMLDRPQMRDHIRAAISLVTGQTVEDQDLILGVLDQNQQSSDLSDLELE